MAVHGSPQNGPGDHAPRQDGDRVVFESGAVPTTPLRIHVVVSEAPTGERTARVALGGELCAMTAPVLRRELEQLLGHGVAGIAMDLDDLALCTSQGVDLFAEVHDRLQRTSGGSLELHGPIGIVARVLQIVRDLDDDFDVHVHFDRASDADSGTPARGGGLTPAAMDAHLGRIEALLDDIDVHLTAVAANEEE